MNTSCLKKNWKWSVHSEFQCDRLDENMCMIWPINLNWFFSLLCDEKIKITLVGQVHDLNRGYTHDSNHESIHDLTLCGFGYQILYTNLKTNSLKAATRLWFKSCVKFVRTCFNRVFNLLFFPQGKQVDKQETNNICSEQTNLI